MNDTPFTTASAAIAHFEAQEVLEPGTPGFWKVWGARPHNARPGDIILEKVEDEVRTSWVEDTFAAKAAPMRAGLVIDGEKVTIGNLCPIILLRWETHNTLA